jgi:hypothetical protein
MNRTRITLLILGVLALGLTACGKSEPAKTNSDAASTATFELNEFSITLPPSSLAAGKVQITAKNAGHETHELVIIRAADAASLPKKADGSVDEDKIPEADKPGEIPDVAGGKSVTKTINLTAGHYVAICNLVETTGMGTTGMGSGGIGTTGMGNSAMTGHIHFMLGMVTTFTVA